MDSIIFDLDGTLWDSIETVLIAWNKVIKESKEMDIELTRKDFKNTMGLQMKDIGKILFPSLDDEKRDHLLKSCCDLECEFLEQHGGSLYPNLEEVLKALSQKFKLFIVSNCQEGYIESFFKYHDLSRFFVDYENPGRTGLTKGENIKLIMDRNNLTSPVYVGDTEGDLKGAEYAGIPFVYAKYGFGKVSHYDYCLEELEDLIHLF